MRGLGCLLLLMGAALSTGAGCGSSEADGDGDGEVGGAGGGGGGASAEPTCAAYCSQVMDNCSGDNAVYASDDICLATCGNMAVGTLADVSGNTLGCRLYHSGAAKDEPGTHCPHAGPGGAGFCGSNCESYCALMATVCTGAFADDTECMAACDTFVDAEPFNANIKTGNTLQCRLYHLSVASVDNIHCGHVGVDPPEGTCTD